MPFAVSFGRAGTGVTSPPNAAVDLRNLTMSRYTIESTQEGIAIVVGWDRPLGSLFAQISDRRISDDESDPMLLWEDFRSTEELARAIAPWAALPDEIRKKLAVESGEKAPARVPAFERPERVVFAGIRCRVVQSVYPHGGIALRLFADDNVRAPYATATVCIPGSGIDESSQCLLKDYEENKGMLEALVAPGVVRPTGRRVKSGYVELHVVDVVLPGTDQDG